MSQFSIRFFVAEPTNLQLARSKNCTDYGGPSMIAMKSRLRNVPSAERCTESDVFAEERECAAIGQG